MMLHFDQFQMRCFEIIETFSYTKENKWFWEKKETTQMECVATKTNFGISAD